MHTFLLTLHNVTRWLVLIFALIAIIRAFSGWFSKKEWTREDNRSGLIYTIVLDIQVLFGIILYIYPGIYTQIMLANPAAAMGNQAIRFYAVEHSFIMLFALLLAHAGRSLSKRAPTDVQKHRRAAVWFTLSLLIILASIPWPFMANVGRPLLRLFGLDL
jgi:hypothetical protein